MKWVLRFFGLLDLVAFVYSFDFALLQINSVFGNDPQTGGEFFTKIAFILLWISLLVSAILLFIPRKAGIILNYVQLLPRLIYLMLSFGFISYITYFFPIDNFDKILMPVIIFLELVRTYYSYKIQKEIL